MTNSLEFFFDCSSPWTYMGFTRLQPLAERYQQEITWKPILVGGVFNSVNKSLYAARESMFENERRLTYYMKDLQDWARLCGIKIGWPDFHPVNSVKAMRGCFVAEEAGLLVPYAQKMFEAYWGDLKDISDDTVLEQLVGELGMEKQAFFEKIQSTEYKDKLRQNTDELIARGGFGSPTMYINTDDMYFGNDKLPLVEARLEALQKAKPS